MKKLFSIFLIGIIAITLTGCGSSEDNSTSLKAIRNAINRVYEKKDSFTTEDVQKEISGPWVIVAVEKSTMSFQPSEGCPKEISESEKEFVWTDHNYFVLVSYNKDTGKYYDHKIMKNSDTNKVYVATESGGTCK